MQLDRIRNFSIIAHIDHGKSTLSDRILEITGAVEARDMKAQYLDSMDLERERGITIKAQNVRVNWNGYTYHLIDTPGHVDFGYEVSRSLAACEGVVLVVDAAQGIEAQTLANCYLALEHDLEIVACLNKIDLPAADPDRYAMEIETVLGIAAEDILKISAKTGDGVPELLDAIAERIPPPSGDADAALQALIFDSQFDQYRGVVSSVRVMNGRLTSGSRLYFMQTGATHDALEIGARRPLTTPLAELGPGEVGYLIAGHQGRRRRPLGRDDHDRVRRARRRRCPATRTRSRWCSPVCSRSTATTSRTCASRSPSSSSTTRRSATRPSRRARSASGSGAGSSGCCTWRSSRSGSSASSTWR